MIVYRILESNPPTEDDFKSYIELGKPIRNPTPEKVREAAGLSVFDTLEAATRKARGRPWMGRAWICALDLDRGVVEIEKTSADPNHFTIWADSDVVRSCMMQVWSLEDAESNV